MGRDRIDAWNSPQVAPAKPRTAEPLWTATKDAQRVDAQLVDQSESGCELRMLQNGEWLSGRRFSDRARAIAHGEDVRQQLESRGWVAEFQAQGR
jgi:hypothetical protein